MGEMRRVIDMDEGETWTREIHGRGRDATSDIHGRGRDMDEGDTRTWERCDE